MPPSTARIARAARELRSGGLVVLPTETVYGLAADAFNPAACARIFALKGRPRLDPLIVHIGARADLARVARSVPAALEPLLDAFWPGPLTVVLPRHPEIPDIVTSGLSTVAVRMPGHPVARAVLRSFGGPLAAPSANRFGRVSPTCAAHVRAEFGARTPFLLDGGPSTHGLESTIVAWRGGRVMILRDGAIPRHEIERVTGAPARSRRGTVLKHPDAPGLLRHHYAPRARVVLLPADWRSAPPASDRRAALLLFRGPIPVGWTRAVVLSPRGSLRVAARRFYAVLRDLDRPGIRAIYADGFPDGGLGDALNDRLRRASARA